MNAATGILRPTFWGFPLILALHIGHDLSAAERLPAGRAQQMLRGVEEIVFAVRERGKNDHYYVNFGNWCGNPEQMGIRARRAAVQAGTCTPAGRRP